MDLNGKRLLIVRLSSLGDLVLVLPAFNALREAYPKAYIAWLVREDLKEVLSGTPGLDEVIPVRIPSFTDKYRSPQRVLSGVVKWLRAYFELWRRFKRDKFDMAIDFQGLFKSAVLAFLLARDRYGFRNGKELSPLFLNKPLFLRDKSRHAVDNYLDVVSYFTRGRREVRFPLFVPQGAYEKMRAFLTSHGVHPGKDFVVFCAPTARWETKFWTQEGFAEVADSLVETYGAKVVFSGLAQERPYIEGITRLMRHKAVIACGYTEIKDFFALIALSHLYIGVDSGAMHVARALGVPVVALFGPSNPKWIGPYGQNRGVVRVALPCSPCNKRRCLQRTCMEAITPRMVLKEVEEVLTGRDATMQVDCLHPERG